MIGVILITLIWIIPASRVGISRSGVSFATDDANAYTHYLEFVKSFGTDDYILLAVENSLSVSDPKLKKRVNTVHRELTRINGVLAVVDIGTIASSGLVRLMGLPHLWDKKNMADARYVLPGLSRLISPDMNTLAFVVKIDNERLNGFDLEKKLEQMKQMVVSAFPESDRCHAAGIPVLRAAFERYNLMSALVFGSLGLVFGTLIAWYIFKRLWAGFQVLTASVLSLVWTLGVMGVFRIELNLATGLSFGFILIVSATTVFHMVSKYLQVMGTCSNKTALVKTLTAVLGPCFMCALTTSVGFFTLVLSPVEMVHQAGLVIAIGVMLAFFLSVPILVWGLPKGFKFRDGMSIKTRTDVLERIVKGVAAAGFQRPAVSVAAGGLFLIVMAWGIPYIKPVKHLTDPVIKHTKEAVDFAYIEKHLSTGASFSVVLAPQDKGVDSRRFWYDLYQFEKKIKVLPGVQDVDSLTSLVFRLALRTSPAGVMPEYVFSQLVSKSAENKLLQSYFDPASNRLRLIVHIRNKSSEQIETILKQVENEARAIFSKTAGITLAGRLILLRSQTADLVSSQIKTLVPAFFVITLLMMIQLRSFILGALSLIPNLFPLVAIFGIMGWFHIPLDPLTIFAAVISFGLSVDDSIHYLTQVKKEMAGLNSRESTVYKGLKNAYDKTARALISTTAVLFLSSTGLLFSSFSHVFSLGVLICSASMIALLADLIITPAVVLTVSPIKYALITGIFKKHPYLGS